MVKSSFTRNTLILRFHILGILLVPEATGLGIKLVSPALSELETLKGLIGDTVKPAGVGEVSDPVGLVGEEVDGVDLLVETVGQDTPDSLRDRLKYIFFKYTKLHQCIV